MVAFACRFEFPQELDMYKYTVQGLEESEVAVGEGEAPPSTATPANPEQYRYFLKGIVVHSGTAFAGHYYSYIKASTARRSLAKTLPLCIDQCEASLTICP